MAVLTEGRTALPTGTWTLDPVHSTIGFELPYLAGTSVGPFTDVDAKLTEDGLRGSARVASVDVKDENLSAHLQSPEFFDAERYPELSFAVHARSSSRREPDRPRRDHDPRDRRVPSSSRARSRGLMTDVTEP